MAKKVPQINASSMADISFLLLIFFLVTTSMDVNQGLTRRLPAPIPPDQKIEDTDINKRNLLVVKINSANQLMVQGQEMNVKQLREKAKEFIANVNDDANLPKLYEEDFYKIDPSGRLSKMYNSIPNQLAANKKRYVISSATGKRMTNKDKEIFSELLDSKTVCLREQSKRRKAR